MSTLVLGDEPVIAQWLAHRRELGQDARDEVWEGVYVVAPHEHGRNGAIAAQLTFLLFEPARQAGLRSGGSFNLGTEQDFRVPDVGFHRGPPDALYFPTAALVVEVLAQDCTRKNDFYARHGIEELWVVDPGEHTVRCWELREGAYEERGASALLGLDMARVAADVDWP